MSQSTNMLAISYLDTLLKSQNFQALELPINRVSNSLNLSFKGDVVSGQCFSLL